MWEKLSEHVPIHKEVLSLNRLKLSKVSRDSSLRNKVRSCNNVHITIFSDTGKLLGMQAAFYMSNLF